MNKKSILKFAQGLMVASALALFAGCDDSSTGADASSSVTSSADSGATSNASTSDGQVLSSGDAQPLSSGAVVGSSSSVDGAISSGDVSLSSSSEGATVVSTGSYNGTPAAIAAVPDSNGFYYIPDIYKAVPTTSKIVFVIRHTERESCESTGAELTEDGIAHAKALGADMVSDEKFYYASTDFVRTRETASYIAQGRGETAEVVTWDAINGDYFLKVSSASFDSLVGKRGGSWKNMSQFIYNATITNNYVAQRIADYVYDIMPRGDQFVSEVVLANMAGWNRVSFLVTHDVLIEPLIVYATNRAIDLKFYESGRWANYMSGIAVVVDEANAVSLYPVRGYELGWIGATKSTTTCASDASSSSAAE